MADAIDIAPLLARSDVGVLLNHFSEVGRRQMLRSALQDAARSLRLTEAEVDGLADYVEALPPGEFFARSCEAVADDLTPPPRFPVDEGIVAHERPVDPVHPVEAHLLLPPAEPDTDRRSLLNKLEGERLR